MLSCTLSRAIAYTIARYRARYRALLHAIARYRTLKALLSFSCCKRRHVFCCHRRHVFCCSRRHISCCNRRHLFCRSVPAPESGRHSSPWPQILSQRSAPPPASLVTTSRPCFQPPKIKKQEIKGETIIVLAKIGSHAIPQNIS